MKENKIDQDISIVKSDIEKHLGVQIVKSESLGGGFNNKIFKLDSVSGESYVLKWYFKDDRNRLSREFSAFEYLRSQGELRLPFPYFRDDEKGYAVYSFESGRTKPGSELSKRNLGEFLSFILFLQNIDPKGGKFGFPEAVLATRSARQFSEVVLSKVKKFEDLVKKSDPNSDVAQFSRSTNVLEKINDYLEVTKKLSGNAFYEEISPSLMRLSPVDFGPHNAIFGNDEKICFIDFEYFGLDDPSKIVANFVTHEGSWGLSHENIKYFIDGYQEKSSLPKDVVRRVKMFIPLQALNWISILLWSFTPQKLESRKFADPNLDENKYISYLTTRINDRLNQLSTFAIK